MVKVARLVALSAFVVLLAASLIPVTMVSALPAFNPATTQKLTAVGKDTTLYDAGSDELVLCGTSSIDGEITSAMLVGSIVMHYSGCESISPASPRDNGCAANSVGAPSGLILTNTLHGVLGLTLPSKSPGLLLLPTSGKTVVTLEHDGCLGEAAMTGNIATLITPIATKTTKGILNFAVSSDKQEIADIETLAGLITPKLTIFGEAALRQEDEVTFEKEVEVT